MRILLALLPFVAACSLFSRAADLPAAPVVTAARDEEAAEWVLLARAWEIRAAGGAGAGAELAGLAAAAPSSLRLAALLQDFAVLDAGGPAGRAELFAQALARAESTGAARDLYLAARLAPRDRALALLDRCLELEPALLPARVLRLGLNARAGDVRILDELLGLLAEHPGLAEGWRLLGQLAPFFARPELALRAAETEPWLVLEDPRLARLYRAECALGAGRHQESLRELEGLTDRRAHLLRASALSELGQIDAARRILEELIAQDSRDAVAHFDLGLLALDRLERPELARAELLRVLELARDGVEIPIQRLVQAEIWLERLPPPLVPAADP